MCIYSALMGLPRAAFWGGVVRTLIASLNLGGRWLGYLAAAMASLLLFLSPAVALSGPAVGGRALQEEEESTHSSDQVTPPRPSQFQPLRPPYEPLPARRSRLEPRQIPANTPESSRREPAVAARVWRPSPLLAEPDPANPLN
jgi:hypothetical protein